MTDRQAHGWAEALRHALDLAVALVAQPTEAQGNPPDTENNHGKQGTTTEIAQDARIAPLPAACGGVPLPDCRPADACGDMAEREAIQSEPPLPPLGSVARTELDEAQCRMIAGLLLAASWPRAPER